MSQEAEGGRPESFSGAKSDPNAQIVLDLFQKLENKDADEGTDESIRSKYTTTP